jgi:hypothetical protein
MYPRQFLGISFIARNADIALILSTKAQKARMCESGVATRSSQVRGMGSISE